MFWSNKKEIRELKGRIAALADCLEASTSRMDDKLDTIIDDCNRENRILLAERTLDKFNDYMKNVEKLHSMINEFKGCVSMARAAMQERKKLDSSTKKSTKNKVSACF